MINYVSHPFGGETQALLPRYTEVFPPCLFDAAIQTRSEEVSVAEQRRNETTSAVEGVNGDFNGLWYQALKLFGTSMCKF